MKRPAAPRRPGPPALGLTRCLRPPARLPRPAPQCRGPPPRVGCFSPPRSGQADREVRAAGRVLEVNANRYLMRRYVDEGILDLITPVAGLAPSLRPGAAPLAADMAPTPSLQHDPTLANMEADPREGHKAARARGQGSPGGGGGLPRGTPRCHPLGRPRPPGVHDHTLVAPAPVGGPPAEELSELLPDPLGCPRG